MQWKWSRGALLRTLALSSSGLLTPGLPALGAYTIVPSGSLDEKRARYAEVTRAFEKDPEDMRAIGEKAQLEYDLRQLQANRAYAQQLRTDLQAGRGGGYLQRLTVPVADIDGAVRFWCDGLGALVRSTRLVGSRRR